MNSLVADHCASAFFCSLIARTCSVKRPLAGGEHLAYMQKIRSICQWVWSERLKPWLEERRVGRRTAALLVAAFVTCAFILPGKPRISVPGDGFVFELPPFRRCNVTFLDPVIIDS